ncbi:MAG: metal-dependent transcriptional regulator [Defluviitaleaceae bacterium]|nr:metal-dependent transcriptional regulator [Defluviitaleaceae bacterium]
MKIQASAEDYLEAILVLTKELGKVRAIDVARHMGYSKPTISIIMKQFRDNGYITLDDERHIYLTEKGADIAEAIHERHTVLSNLLVAIGVDEKTAFADACKMEHNMSEQTFGCIKAYYEKMQGGE